MFLEDTKQNAADNQYKTIMDHLMSIHKPNDNGSATNRCID
jgi:hypothetical protein